MRVRTDDGPDLWRIDATDFRGERWVAMDADYFGGGCGDRTPSSMGVMVFFGERSAQTWELHVCYPDCNADGGLTVADCNEDGALTVSDFGCFQTRFVVGCP